MRLLGKALEQVREEVHGRMEPGEEIVMIGPAGLSGPGPLRVLPRCPRL